MKREPDTPTPPPLLLLVEDHMLIMLQAEDVLRSGGYAVVTAATTKAAMQALDSQLVDAAVLNINLGSQNSFPIAEELVQRGIPFLFTSGHSPDIVPAMLRSVPLLQKPYLPSELLSGVTVLMLEKKNCSA